MKKFTSLTYTAFFLLSLMGITLPLPDALAGGPETCPLPNGISISMVSTAQAIVQWSQSTSVTRIDLRWREAGDVMWTERNDVSSPDTIQGLLMCTAYEIEFRSICIDEFSQFGKRSVFTTDGCCRLPTGVHLASVSPTSVTLQWDSVSMASGFLVRYKRPAGTTWQNVTVNGNGAVISQLRACSVYEVQLRTRCGQDSTQLSETLRIQTTGCGVCTMEAYCTSIAYDATAVWIDSISLGNLMTRTGPGDGYSETIADPTILERDRTYDFLVKPGFRNDTCPVYVRAWLDINQDGMLDDSLELVLDAIDSTAAGVSTSIALDDTIPLGTTRLRVTATYVTDTIGPLSCGSYDFGEVEDYCVVIDDVCPVAELLDTLSVTEDAARFVWESSGKALGYIYRYREEGDNNWADEQITMDTTLSLTGLDKCTDYEFQLVSVCIQDTTEQSLFFSTRCPSAVQHVPEILREVKVYPNPVREVFTLEMTAAASASGQVQLVSLMGQTLDSQSFDLVSGASWRHSYDVLSDAPAGIYLLVIRTRQSTTTVKMVKSTR